uniref:Uncharacterized protein n=1 Tax=viral metagenome TaxID=1070528 RepID=A0A6M3ITN4_9ZZZZ
MKMLPVFDATLGLWVAETGYGREILATTEMECETQLNLWERWAVVAQAAE